MTSVNAAQSQRYPPETAREALRPLVVVSILFLVLNTVFVLLRFISRSIIKKVEFGWDDLLIIPSWVCNIGLCATGLTFAYYESIGNPPAAEVQRGPAHAVPILKTFFALVIIATPSYTLPKTSLLSLYLRIFTTSLFRTIPYILVAAILLFWIASTFTFAFSCSPPSYFWEQATGTHKGRCLNPDRLVMASLPTNVILDLFLLILPIPAVWTLKISKFRKTSFTLLFLTGTIIHSPLVITSRYTVTKISPTVTAPLTTLVIVEPGLYLIAACLPALYPLFSLLAPSCLSANIDRGISAARRRSHRRVVRTTTRRPDLASRRTSSNNILRYGSSFSRLVEQDWRPASSKGPRVTVHQELEYGSGGGVAQALPLRDMRRLPDGEEGIIVQTEIEVTQSERIEAVLGL